MAPGCRVREPGRNEIDIKRRGREGGEWWRGTVGLKGTGKSEVRRKSKGGWEG